MLIGSSEHYGAVVNLDYDYRIYLSALRTDGLNTTRLFTGAYIEKLGDFGMQKNTLALKAGRLVLPWGYALGVNKFGLTKWDDACLARQRDFIAGSDWHGVIVEVTLFSS